MEPISYRVLVVEDEALVAVLIERLVADAGHQVIGIARDGAEALAMVESLSPHVVLMDVDIPPPDGLEVSERLQTLRPTPVVVLTAHQAPDLVERASAAGVGAYLLKPPNLPELERAISIAVARFDDLQRLRALNAELREALADREAALARVKQLEGIIPICMYCKKIRDDQESWWQLEAYITAHSEAMFSHGVCPDCLGKLRAELPSQPRQAP